MSGEQVPDLGTVESPPPRSDIEYTMVKDGKQIGSGGQAIIKEASIPGPEPPDTVAVKEPKGASETLDTEVIKSFFEEAETWNKLAKRERSRQYRDTDHIVGIVAVGKNLPWLIMEYMDGGDLAERLEVHPNGLPIGEALWIAECLCKGVKLAHDNGVAHLDLKPGNILFRETPGGSWDVPKIADWGLARSLLADSQSMEMLSVEYAAPEQFNADEFGKPDKYTDIHQVGAILCEMLTGKPPYAGGQTQIMHSVVYGDNPDPPSSHREEIPEALDDIVLEALSTVKKQRYRGSIDRLEDAISEIRQTDSTKTTLETGEEEWPMFQGGPARTGHRGTTGLQHSITEQWAFQASNQLTSPTVADGTVFVGSNDGHLYAMDSTTGSHKWSFEADGKILSSPAVVDGTVFVGSKDNNLYALDATTGSQLWRFQTDDSVYSSPAVVNNTVFIGSHDNQVYALNATTGAQKWVFKTNSWVQSPAVANGTVFIGNGGYAFHYLYALDATTGTQQWAFELDDNDHQPYAQVGSMLAVADGTVFAGCLDDNVYALDASTGSLLWTFQTNADVISGPTVADSTVFVGSMDDTLYALDTSTGSLLWAFEINMPSSPVVADGIVYVGSHDNHLYALDATSGAQQWAFQADDRVTSSPAVVGGSVFFVDSNNCLHVLSETSAGETERDYRRVRREEFIISIAARNGIDPATIDDTVDNGRLTPL